MIRSQPLFVAAAQLTGAARQLKAGEYEFPRAPRWPGCWTTSATGKVVRHFVTVPEGVDLARWSPTS